MRTINEIADAMERLLHEMRVSAGTKAGSQCLEINYTEGVFGICRCKHPKGHDDAHECVTCEKTWPNLKVKMTGL